YLDFSNYYEAAGLDGFANWYKIQAQEERDHALLFYQYLQKKILTFAKTNNWQLKFTCHYEKNTVHIGCHCTCRRSYRHVCRTLVFGIIDVRWRPCADTPHIHHRQDDGQEHSRWFRQGQQSRYVARNEGKPRHCNGTPKQIQGAERNPPSHRVVQRCYFQHIPRAV
ncbi:MAG: hypothetical protein IIT83_07420, partial [Bacteroidales bacterium]|nr:hypothetical protein [Bacteroidales bacterium]